MILTVASGSLGHYYVDWDGRVYTEHLYVVDPKGLLGPPPGERPSERHQRYAYSTPFWLPTGQVEDVTSAQRLALGDARADLDAAYELAEGTESELCPDCGGVALRDYRLLINGRVPFVCENRHMVVDEAEQPRASGKHVPVRL